MNLKLSHAIAEKIVLGVPFDGVAQVDGDTYVAFNGMKAERVSGDDMHFTLTYNGEPVAHLPTLHFPVNATMTIDRVMGLLQVTIER
jgi:hypothetical protein